MIIGLSTGSFTLLHVAISLVAILAGVVVVAAMIAGTRSRAWTALFLVTTIATSVTGFMFHSQSFGPPHIIGAISLVILALAVYALYVRHLAGYWRPVYIVSAVVALYLNVFVGVVQAFQKIPLLQALAPTQTEMPFLEAQIAVLVIVAAFGLLALRRFRPGGTLAR